MGLKPDWFREHTPAEIIAKVAVITLAEISRWTPEYLDELGWTDNPIISLMYQLNVTTGIWVSRATSDGSVEQEALNASIDTLITAVDAGAVATGLSTDELVKLTTCINLDRLQTVETA